MIDISIIIPIYNSAGTLIESINSVVKECEANPYNWELILVDDGSKDDSGNIVEKYIEQSDEKDRIRFIKQSNSGVAAARNRGLQIARGEFIAFNDSDDRWLEGKLAIQMKYMREHTEVHLLGCSYGDAGHRGSLYKLKETTVISIKAQVLKNYFFPPTVLFRSNVLKKTGSFNENLKYAEEGFFFNNIVYNYPSVFMKIKVAESIIHKKPWGDCGLSGNLLAMEKGELFYINAAYQFHYISFPRYCLAVSYSLAKFLRRCIISTLRK